MLGHRPTIENRDAFIILGAFVGQLADKYDKAKIIRLVKISELVIIAIAIISYKLNSLANGLPFNVICRLLPTLES